MRISRVDGFAGSGLSTALEWVVGDTKALAWQWFADGGVAPVGLAANAARHRQDLAGNAIELVFEFYKARIVPATGRGGGASIGVSDLRLDSSRIPVTIAGDVDADQSANPGIFRWTMPADVYVHPQPAADEVTDAAVAVAYIRRSIGTAALTARFLVVFRRGKP